MGDRYQGAVVSGFFYCRATTATHALAKHLNGWHGMKHRTPIHPGAKRERPWFRDR